MLGAGNAGKCVCELTVVLRTVIGWHLDTNQDGLRTAFTHTARYKFQMVECHAERKSP